MKKKHIITALVLCLFIYNQSFSQQKGINGFVIDNNGDTLVGAAVKLKGSREFTIADKSGRFSIISDKSPFIIEISFIGYKTLIVNKDTLKQDFQKFVLSEKKSEINDLAIIAPSPSGFCVGYFGLLSNEPYGANIAYWTRASRLSIKIKYATDLKNSFIDAEIGPYGLPYTNEGKYLSPYIKEILLDKEKTINSKTLVGNRFILGSTSLYGGIGYEFKSNNDGKIIFQTGLKQNLGLPLKIFMNSYISCDLFFNGYSFDYSGSLNIEFYNNYYKTIALGIGYQSVFSQKDITASIIYKWYRTGKKAKK